MRVQKVRPWLIRLYPRAWRLRYEDEFTALLEQCLDSPLDVLDIILGAMDAHLQLFAGDSLNWRVLNMLNKIRTTILLVFAAYIGFVIAGFSLVGLADDSPMIPLMKTNPALSAAWMTIQAGSVISLLAVVVGGLPLAITVIRRAFTSSRRDLRLLLVPVYSLAALVFYMVFFYAAARGWLHIPGVVQAVQPGNFPIGNRLLLGGLMGVFVLGAAASTAAVWKVISNTDVEQETFHVFDALATIKIYNFAFLPAVIATLVMLVMLVAALVWVRLASSAFPQVFAGNYGLLGMNTTGWFVGTVALMALSTSVAFFGLARGRSAWKTA